MHAREKSISVSAAIISLVILIGVPGLSLARFRKTCFQQSRTESYRLGRKRPSS